LANSDKKPLQVITDTPFESINFIDKTQFQRWVGGVNSHRGKVILNYGGKKGLYSFQIDDYNQTMILEEILPIEFDDIYEDIYKDEPLLIVAKNNQQEILQMYKKTKEFRFTKLFKTDAPIYLRYEKIDGTQGWMNRQGELFDDI